MVKVLRSGDTAGRARIIASEFSDTLLASHFRIDAPVNSLYLALLL